MRKKHPSAASHMHPHWRPNSQPRHVPQPGIKPTTFTLWDNAQPTKPHQSGLDQHILWNFTEEWNYLTCTRYTSHTPQSFPWTMTPDYAFYVPVPITAFSTWTSMAWQTAHHSGHLAQSQHWEHCIMCYRPSLSGGKKPDGPCDVVTILLFFFWRFILL